LIIHLIIQTVLLYPSGAVWTDEASNVSRPDPSGADRIDAEHQATDLAVGSSNPTSGSQTAGERLSGKSSRFAGLGIGNLDLSTHVVTARAASFGSRDAAPQDRFVRAAAVRDGALSFSYPWSSSAASGLRDSLRRITDPRRARAAAGHQVSIDQVWSTPRFRPLKEGEAHFTGGRS
jgi:hypothetical protein